MGNPLSGVLPSQYKLFNFLSQSQTHKQKWLHTFLLPLPQQNQNRPYNRLLTKGTQNV